MTEPISPKEVAQTKAASLPDLAIEAINEMIAQTFHHGSATFQQREVVALMVKKGLKRKDIFDNHWLDIEELYQARGWIVTYDAPGFNESYEATFTFKEKK